LNDKTLTQPTWLLDPQHVLGAMFDLGLSMFRPVGGPYLLADESRATGIFVPDAAVDFLMERGWLTRVDDGPIGTVYLLTAEGRRHGRTGGIKVSRATGVP
jgi:hypothetical protein